MSTLKVEVTVSKKNVEIKNEAKGEIKVIEGAKGTKAIAKAVEDAKAKVKEAVAQATQDGPQATEVSKEATGESNLI